MAAVPSERPSSLPIPPTVLVGRDRDAASVTEVLARSGVRLVTLTGPGGVGKTRLSLRVAEEVAANYADGVVFVPLAAVGSPGLVPSSIAREVGVRETGNRSAEQGLVAVLRSRRHLLLLDNFEQVLPAGAWLAELLGACPGLTVLATSREPLRLSGECEFPVPPLALPDPDLGSLAELAVAPAVRLFAERARAVWPDFALTAENAPDVATICRRLDGLPLAIELAAARAKVLPPATLLTRLEHRLDVLTGGPRDVPERQRTLRGAIAWSHDLLSPEERVVFRRLAVFAGGFTLESAEAVAGGVEGRAGPPPVSAADEGAAGPDVHGAGSFAMLDLVGSLLDKSLLRPAEGINGLPDAGEPRFVMLETVREFALERLAESDEAAALRDAHAAHFLALVTAARTRFEGQDRPAAIARIERERDNTRDALGWALERGDAETARRLAAELTRFWVVLGALTEGRAWLERVVAMPQPSSVAARVDALCWASDLAVVQNDAARGEVLAKEALALAEEGGYPLGEAVGRLQLAIAVRRHEGGARATELLEDARARFRRLGEAVWEGIAVRDLGLVAALHGDSDAAIARQEEALTLFRRLDHPWGVPAALRELALQALRRGDLVDSLALYQESLARWRHQRERLHLGECLLGPGRIAVETGRAEQGVRLIGAAVALYEGIAVVPPAEIGQQIEEATTAGMAALGAEAYRVAWEAGRGLPLWDAMDEVAAITLGPAPGRPPTPPRSAGRDPFGLTPREVDVLALLAEGRTNEEIARHLGVSPRTAATHVGNILTKLDVESRAGAVGQALRHGLL